MNREAVEKSVDKARRYACLARISNPAHVAQLRAMIDYTWEHPIVHKKDRKYGKDTTSLSEAARIVFAEGIKKWQDVDGAWKKFEDFKSGCYQFRDKDDDPYRYVT